MSDRRKPRKYLTWAEKQERHAAKMAKKTPDEVEAYAYNLAVWYLGQKPYSRYQIKEKLITKLVPEEVAELTLDRLAGYGAIDDVSYAESFIRAAAKGRKKSLNSVRFELSRSGVSEEDVETAFELAGISDDDTLRSLIESKIKSTRNVVDAEKRKKKVITAAAARGFSYGDAARVYGELMGEEER